MEDNQQKPMTIDDLAVMVAKGFENTSTKQDLAVVQKDVTDLKQDMAELRHDVSAVKSNLNNYLDLSEKRYSELKHRDALLAGWIKLIAEKTNVAVDVSQLEKI